MSYKTILVHLDSAKNLDIRIQMALAIAKAEQAHLIGIAPLGISPYVLESALSAGSVGLFPADLSTARATAKGVAARFEEQTSQDGWTSCEVHVVEDDAFGSLDRRIRYTDLLVLGQYDPDNGGNPMDASLARDMLLSSGGPILLMPRNEDVAKLQRRALVAWNGSIEARRAVRDALPLLEHAEAVNVVVFSPAGQGAEIGGCLLGFLKRHGISAGLSTQAASYHDVQKMLLSTIAETKSDLLVMGGYGHSPFQEAVLGGVTRSVLHAMPVPVLMSH